MCSTFIEYNVEVKHHQRELYTQYTLFCKEPRFYTRKPSFLRQTKPFSVSELTVSHTRLEDDVYGFVETSAKMFLPE